MINNSVALNVNRPQESMGKNKIIVFEGMSGAGKTTVLSTMAEDFENACILLSEMNLEPHSPETMNPTEKKTDLFHCLWVERMRLLKDYNHLELCFLFDRSYFSNLAFIYALDSINNTFNYRIYKKLFEKTFCERNLDLMLVLDTAPETGLKRRQLRGDNIPWPWSNLAFLEAIREFYKKELPNISQEPIKYINAETEKHELIRDVKSELKKVIKKEDNFFSSYTIPDNKQLEILFDFEANNRLGKASTRLINVLGTPTLYFLKHSIQLEQGHPVFFNNPQLDHILYRYSLLKKV